MYIDLSFPSSSRNFPNNGSGLSGSVEVGGQKRFFSIIPPFWRQDTNPRGFSIAASSASAQSRPSPRSSRVQPCLLKLGFLCNWFPCYWTHKVELHTLASAGTFPSARCQSDGYVSPILWDPEDQLTHPRSWASCLLQLETSKSRRLIEVFKCWAYRKCKDLGRS